MSDLVLNAAEECSAELSSDGVYRYVLSRIWEPDTHPLVFIGLNPSTADATTDDPTIRRCRGFAKREGYGGLVMLNLFAFRSTDPLALRTAVYPVGEWNDDALLTHTKGRDIVLAWGASIPKDAADRAADVIASLQARGHTPFCLGRTKSGQPRHPLYLPASAPMVRYV